MIALLNGIIVQKEATEVVIDCGGVGYQVFVSLNTSEKLNSIGEKAQIHTLLIPKEDALQLFGFIDVVERDVFRLLISVSGIGPKSALAILSSLSVGELQGYVISGNLVALQKLPGIGKKTAERLILELKDKIYKINIPERTSETLPSFVVQEALSALVTLGYNKALAEKAVRRAASELGEKGISAEQLIRVSLKYAMQ